MSSNPFARRSASSGSSNSRSVTAPRKAAIASSSIELLALALDERSELLVLFRRHLRPALLPLLYIGWVQVQLLNDATFGVEVKVDLLVHLVERIEERPTTRIDDIARRLGNTAQV